ncbi:MAG: hypothetical protein DME19_18425 [Verrucomicrobia bacterium]|nr:MAG: hypothetical protein DME19_18425 [Verrucomicrobiota bacterium]
MRIGQPALTPSSVDPRERLVSMARLRLGFLPFIIGHHFESPQVAFASHDDDAVGNGRTGLAVFPQVIFESTNGARDWAVTDRRGKAGRSVSHRIAGDKLQC